MREEFIKLKGFIDQEIGGRSSIQVLEAGCGSISHLHFDREIHLVGIDISKKQLQRNTDLDESILGDIQYYSFPPSIFDIVVCVDVLEHLSKPELALLNFANSAKTNGLIVLKLPNVLSLKGLATKFLPHSLHMLAYRYLKSKRKSASKSDAAPFKTYLKFSTAPNAIRRFAFQNGLTVVYFDTYDITATDWLLRKRTAHAVYRLLKAVFRFMSFGRINDSEFILVLKKVADR
jgi:SAM-dependent methyltransferase